MLFPYHDDNPTYRAPLVTIAIIGANLISLLYVNSLPLLDRDVLVVERGFVPARLKQWNHPELIIEVPLSVSILRRLPDGKVVAEPQFHRLEPDRSQIAASIFSAMFLHGGWLHFLGNMWFLWLFGNNVESRIGHAPFALLYALGGLAAWIAHCAFLAPEAGYQPVIGASGAVAAVLGAYAVAWPHARIRCALFLFFILFVELPALLVLGIWFAMQIFSALAEQNALGGGVAWWAHVGGFVAGMAMMPIFASIIADPAPRRRETFWDPE